MRKSIVALLAVGMMLFAGALVAGCGGGDDSTTNGGEVASKEGSEEKKAESPPGGGGPSSADGPGAGESRKEDSSAGRGEFSPGDESDRRSGGETPTPEESPNAESDGVAEDGASVSTPKADFVAKANQLCTEQRKKIQAKVRTILEAAKKAGALETAVRRMIDQAVAPGMEEEADELRKLEAPSGDGEKVAAIASSIDATVAELRKDPTVVQTSLNVFEDAQRAATAYGIGACARAA